MPLLTHSDFDEATEAAHIYEFYLPGSHKTVCKDNWQAELSVLAHVCSCFCHRGALMQVKRDLGARLAQRVNLMPALLYIARSCVK